MGIYIVVRTMTGTKFHIEVDQTDSVLSLKQRIKDLTNVDTQSLLLVHGKFQMDCNNSTLKNYEVSNNSVINMILLTHGG